MTILFKTNNINIDTSFFSEGQLFGTYIIFSILYSRADDTVLRGGRSRWACEYSKSQNETGLNGRAVDDRIDDDVRVAREIEIRDERPKFANWGIILTSVADWLFCKSGREIEGEICRLVPVGRRVCRMVPVCRLSKQVCKLDHESANLAELADWSTESAD